MQGITRRTDTPGSPTGKGNRAPRKSQAVAEVEAAEKLAKALELRRKGHTYRTIAQAVGYNDGAAAYKAIHAELTRWVEPHAKALQALRVLEAQRLDDLTRAIVDQALLGDLPAIDRVLRIMERRARLLGLDLATRRDNLEDSQGVTITIIRRDSQPGVPQNTYVTPPEGADVVVEADAESKSR